MLIVESLNGDQLYLDQ